MALSELRAFYEDREARPVLAVSPQSQQWTKGIVTVVCAKDDEKVDLPAYVKEGLAVHHGYLSERGWTITHRQSGLRFPHSYPTKAKAIDIAEQLLCIEGLWDNPLEAFARGLSETDVARVNRILGTNFKARTVEGRTKAYMRRIGIEVEV